DLVRTSEEFLEASWAAAAGGGAAPVDLGAAGLRSFADVRAHTHELGVPWWTISAFAVDESLDTADDEAAGRDLTVASAARPVDAYRGDTKHALDDIRGWLHDGWRVVVLTEGHGPAERLVEVLRGEDVAARLENSLAAPPEAGVVHVSTGCLQTGFT